MWPANPFLELNRLEYLNEVWNPFECWKSLRRFPAENFTEVNDIAYRFVYDVVASKPLHCWANKFPMKRINPHRKSISDYCRLALHARAASFNVKAEVPINSEPAPGIPSSSYDAIAWSPIHWFILSLGNRRCSNDARNAISIWKRNVEGEWSHPYRISPTRREVCSKSHLITI